MPDPIRDLENFPVTPVEPLPAAEVRRRGDRARRRRTAAAGGLAVAAVVAVASLGVTVGGLPGDDGGQVAPGTSPSTSTPSTPTDSPVPEPSDLGPVTTDHLLADAELAPLAGTDWSIGQTYPGGSEPAFSCDQGLVGIDAAWAPQRQEQVWQKVWHIEGTITLQQSVASFPTAQAAEKVVENAGEMLQRCEGSLVQDWTPQDRIPHVQGANQSFVVDATWRDDVEEGGESFAEHRSIVGVVRVGTRVSILSLDAPVGTRGLPTDGSDTPVDTMMAAVVERLSATP